MLVGDRRTDAALLIPRLTKKELRDCRKAGKSRDGGLYEVMPMQVAVFLQTYCFIDGSKHALEAWVSAESLLAQTLFVHQGCSWQYGLTSVQSVSVPAGMRHRQHMAGRQARAGQRADGQVCHHGQLGAGAVVLCVPQGQEFARVMPRSCRLVHFGQLESSMASVKFYTKSGQEVMQVAFLCCVLFWQLIACHAELATTSRDIAAGLYTAETEVHIHLLET